MWENTPGCGESAFLDTMWTAIDEAVTLQECEVYSYKSDGETDPFGKLHSPCSGTIQSSCYRSECPALPCALFVMPRY